MRTLLLSLLLASAALTALPSASAAELPVGCSQAVGACVWWDQPNGDCVGAHVGFQGGGACASTEEGTARACSSLHVTSLGNCPTDPVMDALHLPDVTCNPDLAGPCVRVGATYACVGTNVGTQGVGACVDRSEGLRVCTSLRSVLWDGFCPTDGTILDELIVLP